MSSADAVAPIGVFDSGVGGLSVAREIVRLAPSEALLYYADTAHVPYGGRPLDEVRGFALGICDYLVARGAKMIVMACNISSAVALDLAAERHPDIPVLGVLRPGARAACDCGARRIGVLATEGTVASGAYERALRQIDPTVAVVQVACPKFVPLVEAGETEGSAARSACAEYLAPLADAGCDAVILGCTHYPFLLPMLSRCADRAFAAPPAFVDPAGETARAVVQLLRDRSLGAPAASAPPQHEYVVSGDPVQFRAHAPLLLGSAVGCVSRAA